MHAGSLGFAVGVTEVGEGVAGRGKGVFVAGRVAVRKRGAGVGAFDEIETLHAVITNTSGKVKSSFLFILKHHHLALDLFDGIAGDLFIERFTRQDRDRREGAQ